MEVSHAMMPVVIDVVVVVVVRPVQYNLWFDICISFDLCTSMFCYLGHDQATEGLCSKEDVKYPYPTLMSTI